jgi:hypothetical protein
LETASFHASKSFSEYKRRRAAQNNFFLFVFIKTAFSKYWPAKLSLNLNISLINLLTHRAIKVAFIFLKRPEKTKIFKKEVEGSNRP